MRWSTCREACGTGLLIRNCIKLWNQPRLVLSLVPASHHLESPSMSRMLHILSGLIAQGSHRRSSWGDLKKILSPKTSPVCHSSNKSQLQVKLRRCVLISMKRHQGTIYNISFSFDTWLSHCIVLYYTVKINSQKFNIPWWDMSYLDLNLNFWFIISPLEDRNWLKVLTMLDYFKYKYHYRPKNNQWQIKHHIYLNFLGF